MTDVIAYLAQGSECKRKIASIALLHTSAELAHSSLTYPAHSPPFLGRQHKKYLLRQKHYRQKKFSRNYFPITDTECRIFRINFDYRNRISKFSNYFRNNFGAKGRSNMGAFVPRHLHV